MINNLRWLSALGAVYVAGASVGVAHAAGPDDRPGPHGPGAVAAAAPRLPTAKADGRFAWDDAALSALASLALIAGIGAGAVSIRYPRGPKLS